MMNQFVSMVGSHFKELEVKLLCAQIDQRTQKNLPSLELRLKLSEEIMRIGKLQGYLSPKQEKARIRVRRDINAFFDPDEDVVVSCTHKSGKTFQINVTDNRMIWDNDGFPQSINFRYRNHIVHSKHLKSLVPRELHVGHDNYAIQGPEFEEVFFNDIDDCDNWHLLEAIFEVSEEEKKLLATKICSDCGARAAIPSRTEVIVNESENSRPVVKYECTNCHAVFYK
ncbi:hypothetical protein [Paenibacillus hubeiensis]|uniref:hypothetical protein n=1 Tax=Paenibacillus hubeiensis TaxID=3077330 RepID=UPI0031BAEEC6